MTVLSSHGEIASEKKSFMHVFTNVNTATRPHLCQVSSTTVMNTVLELGPKLM